MRSIASGKRQYVKAATQSKRLERQRGAQGETRGGIKQAAKAERETGSKISRAADEETGRRTETGRRRKAEPTTRGGGRSRTLHLSLNLPVRCDKEALRLLPHLQRHVEQEAEAEKTHSKDTAEGRTMGHYALVYAGCRRACPMVCLFICLALYLSLSLRLSVSLSAAHVAQVLALRPHEGARPKTRDRRDGCFMLRRRHSSARKQGAVGQTRGSKKAGRETQRD